MTTFSRLFLPIACASILAASASARDFSDPTWPCIQRKVPRLSLGVIWPLPPVEGIELDQAATDLADILVLRRVSLEEAEVYINEFAQAHPEATPELYTAIYSSVFSRLDQLRSNIIDGIGDFSLSQIDLSEKIETIRQDMDTALAADEPDYDKLDEMEVTLDWSERIFRDRQSVVTYVCESPVLIEQRLFALGRLMVAHAQ